MSNISTYQLNLHDRGTVVSSLMRQFWPVAQSILNQHLEQPELTWRYVSTERDEQPHVYLQVSGGEQVHSHLVAHLAALSPSLQVCVVDQPPPSDEVISMQVDLRPGRPIFVPSNLYFQPQVDPVEQWSGLLLVGGNVTLLGLDVNLLPASADEHKERPNHFFARLRTNHYRPSSSQSWTAHIRVYGAGDAAAVSRRLWPLLRGYFSNYEGRSHFIFSTSKQPVSIKLTNDEVAALCRPLPTRQRLTFASR